MHRYLPKHWKQRFAAGLALLFMVIAGLPLMFSIVLVLAAKLWPVLLPISVLVLVGRILARWRR